MAYKISKGLAYIIPLYTITSLVSVHFIVTSLDCEEMVSGKHCIKIDF